MKALLRYISQDDSGYNAPDLALVDFNVQLARQLIHHFEFAQRAMPESVRIDVIRARLPQSFQVTWLLDDEIDQMYIGTSVHQDWQERMDWMREGNCLFLTNQEYNDILEICNDAVLKDADTLAIEIDGEGISFISDHKISTETISIPVKEIPIEVVGVIHKCAFEEKYVPEGVRLSIFDLDLLDEDEIREQKEGLQHALQHAQESRSY